MYNVTVFKNRFDNEIDKTISIPNWQEFVEFFNNLNQKRYKKKEDAPLISPALYKPGTKRANDNVIEWSGWCSLDIDDLTCPKKELVDIIKKRFGKWDFICHSTGSASKEHPKCRLIVRLDKPVPHDSIRHFWFALNNEAELLGDAQTKDFSRMFYVPGKVKGSINFIFDNFVDNPLPVDELLEKHPYVEKTGNTILDKLPEGIRQQMLDYKKQQLTNTTVTWTSYRDCKFWPKKLEREYRNITGTGWYHALYRIMVAIACNAIKDKYPISVDEIVKLVREFDRETGNWYRKRPIHLEAASALNYAYSNSLGL